MPLPQTVKDMEDWTRNQKWKKGKLTEEKGKELKGIDNIIVNAQNCSTDMWFFLSSTFFFCFAWKKVCTENTFEDTSSFYSGSARNYYSFLNLKLDKIWNCLHFIPARPMYTHTHTHTHTHTPDWNYYLHIIINYILEVTKSVNYCG